MNTTWTKLNDGSWGLRSTVALSEGEVVTVCRKDGSRSKATVGRRVWTGNGVWLYATAPKAEKVAPVVAPKVLILDWSEAEALDGEDAETAAELAAERAVNCDEAFYGF